MGPEHLSHFVSPWSYRRELFEELADRHLDGGENRGIALCVARAFGFA